VGRRSRQRSRAISEDSAPAIAPSEYCDAEGNLLVLRASLSPSSRRRYAETLAAGLNRDDARQRAIELLFEQLAVSWTIAGLELVRQKELLGRYRMASESERAFVLQSLRRHAGERFPELDVA
jgi:hypothetical protein